MDSRQLLAIVEQYCRKVAWADAEVTITRIANHKTMYVEQSGESGRAVMLTEYKVDGITCWAGFSSRSQTLYISMTA